VKANNRCLDCANFCFDSHHQPPWYCKGEWVFFPNCDGFDRSDKMTAYWESVPEPPSPKRKSKQQEKSVK